MHRQPAVSARLLAESQDAALTAIQVFNNPLIRFKSETFLVLMNIAWTHLLHAYYRREKVEYRYFHRVGSRRRFERTAEGSFKYWDLSRCLSVRECPLDGATQQNLKFLIGLRDEITHHVTPLLDQFASARYQACSLNYNRDIKRLFGDRLGIDGHLGFCIQFQALSREQLAAPTEGDLPGNVRAYIARFDRGLAEDDLNSANFAFRVLFVPKLVGKPGQADEVVEFVRSDSDVARAVNAKYVTVKEVERPKFLPSQVVQMMREEGFADFSMHQHTELWRSLSAKDPAKGYGTAIAGAWYWYSKWIDTVRRHCEETYATQE